MHGGRGRTLPVPMQNIGPKLDTRGPELPGPGMGRGVLPLLDGAEHTEVRRAVWVQWARDACEERKPVQKLRRRRREPELHGEDAVVQGEGEVAQRAEAEARARWEEKAVAPRADGVEEQLERGEDAEIVLASARSHYFQECGDGQLW